MENVPRVDARVLDFIYTRQFQSKRPLYRNVTRDYFFLLCIRHLHERNECSKVFPINQIIITFMRNACETCIITVVRRHAYHSMLGKSLID